MVNDEKINYCCPYHRKNYYQNLKDNIQDDIERVLYLISPQCSVGSIQGSVVFEESQNDYYLVDKKKLLDIDGKSYCKIKVNPRCVSDGKLEWDTYIKCKNYQDEGYEDDK